MGLEGSANDGLLTRLIGAVSAEIVAYCEQPIVREADNVLHQFSGTGEQYTLLPYFPIHAVTALSYIDSIGGSAVVVAADQFSLVPTGPLVYLGHKGGLVGGYQYSATLTVGRESVPADVEAVAVEMVAVRAWESAGAESGITVGKQRLGKQSESVASGGVTKSTVYTRPDWAARLAPYRVISI